ncbi:MAG: hypothetical protein A2Z45_10055 [Chloroflexi bacterium RBG_19FT_COMBO_55_16]|nr:MAG: hypothetical protein A2Z45_10055 [Chloroflexi bacterium RBG_19FT_COMBO_55_16]
MYLIPFARLTLFSPKSPEAVSQLLLRAVPPNGTEPKISKHTHREYYGSIWKESFVIQRNLNYQNQLYPWITKFNAFVPIMHGALKPYPEGTKIIVTALFSPIKLGFALLFYAVLLLPMIFYLHEVTSRERVEWNVALMGLPLLILFYLWHTISFNHEVNKVKDFLSKVVRAGSTSGTNVMIPPNSRCT